MNNVTIITGSTSGIGRAIYKNFSSGFTCLCIDRNQNRLEELIGNSGNIYFICDLQSEENIKALFDFCQGNELRIANLIHCAGLRPLSDYCSMTRKEMEDTFQVNVFAFAMLCKYLFGYKNRKDLVHVLAISSIAAERASGRQAIYASSKAALYSLILSSAQEGLKHGIRVNALSLGAVDTPMLRDMNASESYMANIERHYPLGVMKPETVADIVRSLVSGRFDHMAGSIVKIDSGFGVVH